MPKRAAKKVVPVRRPVKKTNHAHTFLIITAIFLVALIVVAVLLHFSYIQVPPQSTGDFCGTSSQAACSSDSGCVTGGCSGQVCQGTSEPPTAGTCEWRDCYAATNYGLSCGCVAQKCAWKK
jgi:eight-cysteine-cluster-containing protein